MQILFKSRDPQADELRDVAQRRTRFVFRRLDWLVPKAIVHNRPDNPNVVLSWRANWDELPECALKDEAYRVLKPFVEQLGKGFAEAFAKACPGGSANQEQEQEQEQEGESARASTVPPVTEATEPLSLVRVRSAPVADPMGDDEIGEAWAAGVFAGSGSKMTRPRGEPLRRLIEAARTHGPTRKGPNGSRDVAAWMRGRGEAYGESARGVVRNVFKFCDWLDSGNGKASEPDAPTVDDDSDLPPAQTEADRLAVLELAKKHGYL